MDREYLHINWPCIACRRMGDVEAFSVRLFVPKFIYVFGLIVKPDVARGSVRPDASQDGTTASLYPSSSMSLASLLSRM